MTCAASIGFTENYPPDPGSEYAAEGSVAHIVREECLSLGLDAWDFIGHRYYADGYIFECTEDMAEFLQPGIDRVRQFEGKRIVEYRLPLDRWMQGDFGTLDVGIAGREWIVISDLKFGVGIPVSPVRNKQLMIYALGFWWYVARHITKATKFLIIIDQPRNGAGGGEWEVSLRDLLEFGKTVKVRAEMTEDPNAEFTPSDDGCFWCQAARDGSCIAHEKWQLAKAGDLTFQDLDGDWELPDLDDMTPERRMEILDGWPSFLKWGERLKKRAISDFLNERHDQVPGKKVVYGKPGNRVFKEKPAIIAGLEKVGIDRQQMYTRKFFTPAAAERIIGKGNVPESLYERSAAKPILVSVEDKRPAVLTDVAFDNLETENEENE